ncbi:Alkylated DNA repair protein [Enhygromyxa salina]|uniref:Alkylated DNA repair protein n=1 Tax=Enhygromyxa salina TaxID=215803 RepID=A0A0C1ZBY0_9BACT|nr:alpha-ketoglutarate-dependent dioxygenase AlkB [Enhygromyxa salina]KIG15199.1 Alkylated DNA repair protein [Enhygromyxa salina]
MATGWTYIPDFISDPAELLRTAINEVAWTQQMRSRQTASLGIPYNYAGASYPEAPWLPAIWDVALAVEARFGFTPTNCLMNYYPTGEHSIGWHTDDVTILAPDTGIAIVSLGETRTLRLRAGVDPNFEYTHLPLAAGSLLYMTADLQHTHKHCIKPEPGAGPRISLTFRHLTHAPPPVTTARWSRQGDGQGG